MRTNGFSPLWIASTSAFVWLPSFLMSTSKWGSRGDDAKVYGCHSNRLSGYGPDGVSSKLRLDLPIRGL